MIDLYNLSVMYRGKEQINFIESLKYYKNAFAILSLLQHWRNNNIKFSIVSGFIYDSECIYTSTFRKIVVSMDYKNYKKAKNDLKNIELSYDKDNQLLTIILKEERN